jgi:hypothetical protein
MSAGNHQSGRATVTAASAIETLPVQRAGQLETVVPGQRWLIRSIWARSAVGILGGPPKSCKSYLGLELATSVATGIPALSLFPIDRKGRVLIYLAEDSLPLIRSRLEAICDFRKYDIRLLDLHVICSPVLRLDLKRDQQRLINTVDELRPTLLLLDPLVRLHRLDENSSTEMSGLLGFLRELQRQFDLAIILVHHASKKQRAHPGLSLRGSGDLWAFGDSNAYLSRKDDHLMLTLEHRAAQPPDPIALQLVSRTDGSATHIEVCAPSSLAGEASPPLDERILDLLATADGPMPRTTIRSELRVNNNRLGDYLAKLQRNGLLLRFRRGWTLRQDMVVDPSNGRPQQPLFD